MTTKVKSSATPSLSLPLVWQHLVFTPKLWDFPFSLTTLTSPPNTGNGTFETFRADTFSLWLLHRVLPAPAKLLHLIPSTQPTPPPSPWESHPQPRDCVTGLEMPGQQHHHHLSHKIPHKISLIYLPGTSNSIPNPPKRALTSLAATSGFQLRNLGLSCSCRC